MTHRPPPLFCVSSDRRGRPSEGGNRGGRRPAVASFFPLRSQERVSAQEEREVDERFSVSLVAVPRNSPTAKAMRVVVSVLRVPLPVKRRGAQPRHEEESGSDKKLFCLRWTVGIVEPWRLYFPFFSFGGHCKPDCSETPEIHESR